MPAQDRPYVFACHPHGVLALAMPPSFASDGSNFSKQFPGIDLRVAVANIPLYLPIARQIARWSGGTSADMYAIEYSLTHGQSGAIVACGPDEALLAGTGKMRLVLRDRAGFVKTAIQTGADMVPVLTYGENDAFRQVFQSFIKQMQAGLVKRDASPCPSSAFLASMALHCHYPTGCASTQSLAHQSASTAGTAIRRRSQSLRAALD